jgi:predicted ABC-type ATPase
MDGSPFDERPLIVAIAGPNGAGKTTFYHAHLQSAGLRFVSADAIALELGLDAYEAARAAGVLRQALVDRGESFVFETVFSDPVGDKLMFLKEAAEAGYTVVLCFVGIDGPAMSEQRVSMRVSQGGHDVPTEKLYARYPRILANLTAAIRELPHVLVFDNTDLNRPFHNVARFEQGQLIEMSDLPPEWVRALLP